MRPKVERLAWAMQSPFLLSLDGESKTAKAKSLTGHKIATARVAFLLGTFLWPHKEKYLDARQGGEKEIE